MTALTLHDGPTRANESPSRRGAATTEPDPGIEEYATAGRVVVGVDDRRSGGRSGPPRVTGGWSTSSRSGPTGRRCSSTRCPAIPTTTGTALSSRSAAHWPTSSILGRPRRTYARSSRTRGRRTRSSRTAAERPCWWWEPRAPPPGRPPGPWRGGPTAPWWSWTPHLVGTVTRRSSWVARPKVPAAEVGRPCRLRCDGGQHGRGPFDRRRHPCRTCDRHRWWWAWTERRAAKGRCVTRSPRPVASAPP